jgi:hypothetical protein
MLLMGKRLANITGRRFRLALAVVWAGLGLTGIAGFTGAQERAPAEKPFSLRRTAPKEAAEPARGGALQPAVIGAALIDPATGDEIELPEPSSLAHKVFVIEPVEIASPEPPAAAIRKPATPQPPPIAASRPSLGSRLLPLPFGRSAAPEVVLIPAIDAEPEEEEFLAPIISAADLPRPSSVRRTAPAPFPSAPAAVPPAGTGPTVSPAGRTSAAAPPAIDPSAFDAESRVPTMPASLAMRRRLRGAPESSIENAAPPAMAPRAAAIVLTEAEEVAVDEEPIAAEPAAQLVKPQFDSPGEYFASPAPPREEIAPRQREPAFRAAPPGTLPTAAPARPLQPQLPPSVQTHTVPGGGQMIIVNYPDSPASRAATPTAPPAGEKPAELLRRAAMELTPSTGQ